MKLAKLTIKNLRTFKDVTVTFGNYNCLVGSNGAGKSTVLTALNILFRENSASSLSLIELAEEDFSFRDTSKPIEIIATFNDLNAAAREDLKDYVRNEELVLSCIASYNPEQQTAEVFQRGERLGIEEFRHFFELVSEDAKKEVLEAEYARLKGIYPAITAPYGSKAKAADNLHKYEVENPSALSLIPSNDQFYGWQGSGKLAPYIQWVFIPAVKDATEEQIEGKQTVLGKLVGRLVRSKVSFKDKIKELTENTIKAYGEIVDADQSSLDELSKSLTERFAEWSHPDTRLKLIWGAGKKPVAIADPLAELIAGEDQFEGSLERFGHGLQRSYIVTLLQELANSNDGEAPTLLLGFEEPELYQHPPQIKHLADTLQQLSNTSQIIVATHSPLFVEGEYFEDVRVVKKQKGGASTISSILFDNLAAKLHECGSDTTLQKSNAAMVKLQQELQPSTNELFFCDVPILVEGLEDKSYILAYMALTGAWSDFRKFGCHIIAAGGKSHLIRPYAASRMMCLPAFLVFDGDWHEPKPENLAKHKKDNEALFSLAGYGGELLVPGATIWKHDVVIWKSEIGEIFKAEINVEAYKMAKEKAEAYCDRAGDLAKNHVYVSKLVELLWEQGHKSESIIKLCETIISFAHALRSKPSIDISSVSAGGPLPESFEIEAQE